LYNPVKNNLTNWGQTVNKWAADQLKALLSTGSREKTKDVHKKANEKT
jgi:hypothetical protein